MSNSKLSVKVNEGFSLIEVTIGVLILGLVLTGVASVYKQELDVDNLNKQRIQVGVIHDSINTYLKANRYLPCPDTDGNGYENRVDSGGKSVCVNREGALPFADLGVAKLDAWGNPYYYRVNLRAENNQYINDICEPASVLGLSGAYDLGDIGLCPSTNIYYCDNKCAGVCSDTCTAVEPRLDTKDSDNNGSPDAPGPPYFHLATPPYGSLSGSGNLTISDESGNDLGAGIVAIIISWGADGDSVNLSSCASGAINKENCDGDDDFIDTRTGKERDYVDWVTVHQAKSAIISQRKFR